MKLTTTALFITALAFSSSAYAGPSANRTKDGGSLLEGLFSTSEEPSKPAAPASSTSKLAYDGVWQGKQGQLLLLKQVHQTLFLSASDDHSSWQAQCNMDKTPVYCLGYGSGTEQDFHYNAYLNQSGNALRIDWQTTGRKLGDKHSGQTAYQKVL